MDLPQNKTAGVSKITQQDQAMVRRSSSSRNSSSTDVPPPSAFYFPTNHEQPKPERASTGSRKEKFFNGQQQHQAAAVSRSFDDLDQKQRKSARGIIKKTIKKTQKVMMACLEDGSFNGEKDQQTNKKHAGQDQTGSGDAQRLVVPSRAVEQSKHYPTLGIVVARMPSSKNLPVGKAVRKKSIEENKDGSNNVTQNIENELEQQPNQNIDSIALHHEEAYFERLSLSEEDSIEASPFVRHAPSNRISAILEKDSGIDGLLRSTSVQEKADAEAESLSSAASDLFSSSNSILNCMKKNVTNSPIPNANAESTYSPAVSSMLRFYSASGPMEASPQVSYNSELEESPKKRDSSESHSSLYTNEKVMTGNVVSTQVITANGGKLEDIGDILHPDDISPIENVAKRNKDPFCQNMNDYSTKSKLESLFRPILPMLSSDDAQDINSFNPFEIKVTESAPGVLTTVGSHVMLAPRMERSFSTMSMDTQRCNPTKDLVSLQAKYNGEFLFSDEGKTILGHRTDKARESSSLSISTASARSRLTQRSTREKGVFISQERQSNSYIDTRPSMGSYKSERRVRFSIATIEDDENRRHSKSLKDGQDNAKIPITASTNPRIEYTVSDLTDAVGESVGRQSSGVVSFPSSILRQSSMDDDRTRISSPVDSIANVFRSTAARISNDSQAAPAIKSKLSDLTADTSIWNSSSRDSMPTTVPEEGEDSSIAVSSQGSIHWVVSANGVTPSAKGRSMKRPTKSPLKRFKQAKQSFSMDNREMAVKVNKPSSGGGLVATRVEELNTRVSEIRKIKRMRKKFANPRLHTHQFDNKQPVRSRALITYKTQFASADVEKSNAFMAAKFNVIPDNIDDEEDDVSEIPSQASFPSIRQAFAHDENSDIESTNDPTTGFLPAKYSGSDEKVGKDDDEEDEDSKFSDGTMSVSIATVRQERTGPRPRMYSESTASTTSSGFSNIRRQGSRLFRESEGGVVSIVSNGDNSTTLSAVMQKENEFSLPFRSAANTVKPSQQNMHALPSTLYLSPTQRTPSQALKWRTLAAAAQKKDAEAAASKVPRRGLGIRSTSHQNVKAP